LLEWREPSSLHADGGRIIAEAYRASKSPMKGLSDLIRRRGQGKVGADPPATQTTQPGGDHSGTTYRHV
jgi:hypothetical protein